MSKARCVDCGLWLDQDVQHHCEAADLPSGPVMTAVMRAAQAYEPGATRAISGDAEPGPMFLPMPDERAEAQRQRFQAAVTLTQEVVKTALDEIGIESRKIPEPQWPLPPTGTRWSDWQVTESAAWVHVGNSTRIISEDGVNFRPDDPTPEATAAQSDAAFDAWWPRHAVRHNSRSPVAAREAFTAGWEAAALHLRDRVYACQVAVQLPHVGEDAAAVLMSDLLAIFTESGS